MGKVFLAALISANLSFAVGLEFSLFVWCLFFGTVLLFYLVPSLHGPRLWLQWIHQSTIGALALFLIGPHGRNRPRYQIILFIIVLFVIALIVAAPLDAAIVSGLVGLILVLLIQIRWGACEDKRAAISQMLLIEDPDRYPDLRPLAFFSALLLFPIFALTAHRAYEAGVLPALILPEAHVENFFWLVFDQFLKAFIFDVLEVFDWAGFSGASISSPSEMLNLERSFFCLMRLSFAGIVINAFVRIREISRNTSDAARAFSIDPWRLISLGARASARLPAALTHRTRPDTPVSHTPQDVHARSIARLIQQLRSDAARGATGRAANAARAISRLQTRTAAPALLSAIKLGDAELQVEAAVALVEIGEGQLLDDAVTNKASEASPELLDRLLQYANTRSLTGTAHSTVSVFKFIHYLTARTLAKKPDDFDSQWHHYFSQMELAKALLRANRNYDVIRLIEVSKIRASHISEKIRWDKYCRSSPEEAFGFLLTLVAEFESLAWADFYASRDTRLIDRTLEGLDGLGGTIRRFDDAQEFIQSIDSFELKDQKSLAVANVFLQRYRLYVDIGDLSYASKLCAEAITLALNVETEGLQKSRDVTLLEAYFRQGQCFLHLNLNNAALDALHRARTLVKHHDSELLRARIAVYLAAAAQGLALASQATEYAEEAIDLFGRAKNLTHENLQQLLAAYVIRGGVLIQQYRISLAESVIRTAQEINSDLIERYPDNEWLRITETLLKLKEANLLASQGLYVEATSALIDARAQRRTLLERNPASKDMLERLHTANVDLFYAFIDLEQYDEAQRVISYQDELIVDWSPHLASFGVVVIQDGAVKMQAELALARGDIPSALVACRRRITALEGADDETKANVAWSESLQWAFVQMGRVYAHDSQIEKSLDCYKRALLTLDTVELTELDQVWLLSQKSYIQRLVSSAHAEAYDEIEALLWSHRASDILKHASDLEQGHLGLRLESVRLIRRQAGLAMGEASFSVTTEKNREIARALIGEAIELIETVPSEEAEHGFWLETKCYLLRDMAFTYSGPRVGIEYCEKALRIALDFMTRQRQSVAAQMLVATLLVNLADEYIGFHGQTTSAADLRRARKMLARAQRIVGLQPRGDNLDWRRIQSIISRALGDYHFKKGFFGNAAREYLSIADYSEITLRKRPNDPTLLRDVAFWCFRAAMAIRKASSSSRSRSRANSLLARGLEIWRGLLARFPTHEATIRERIGLFERAMSDDVEWLRQPELIPSYQFDWTTRHRSLITAAMGPLWRKSVNVDVSSTILNSPLLKSMAMGNSVSRPFFGFDSLYLAKTNKFDDNARGSSRNAM